jgi:hypothetical protein
MITDMHTGVRSPVAFQESYLVQDSNATGDLTPCCV